MTIPQTFDLALQRHRAGRLAEAEALYRQILAVESKHADSLHLLGVIAHQLGRHDLAAEWIRKAIAVNPANADYYFHLGNAQAAQRHLDEAIVSYRQALRLKPDFPEAHNNLGAALQEQGHFDEAADACRRALELQPDFADARYNLATALQEQGQLDAAATAYRRTLELRPGHPEAHNNLGNVLRDLGRLDDAVDAYHRALHLKPGFPEAHNNLGVALKDLGQLDEAIASYRRALQLQPDHHCAHSNLVFAAHYHPAHDAATIAEEHRRWNRQFGDPLKQFIRPHANDRNPGRRLRIGYVSPDFYSQAECYFVAPLLEAHDHTAFEVHAYASVRHPDAITEQLKKSVDFWHDARRISDSALAEQIRKDGIDILIDLTMHMRDNRLLLFCRQPAPIQVSWLAYPGSTGLGSIGYRLTDAHIDPPGEHPTWSSEAPVRLPDSWCCYLPLGESPEVSILPALSTGRITFGSLNSSCKVNEGVLARWARGLRAVEGSRLLMLCPEGRARQRILGSFETHGIAAHRVELVGPLPRMEYLRLYQRIDLGLDPFPYNGITTTCDSLWMGVPVLTLPGTMPSSRAGVSLLSTVGLGEFTASSEEDYVRIAAELARDLPRLAELRSTMRARMRASPLMDAPRFARNVEAAYRSMWQAWCARQSPSSG